MIRYLDSAASVSASQLQGFFVGWPNPPTPATHLKILQVSTAQGHRDDAKKLRAPGRRVKPEQKR